jgi:hypothetical protein
LWETQSEEYYMFSYYLSVNIKIKRLNKNAINKATADTRIYSSTPPNPIFIPTQNMTEK